MNNEIVVSTEDARSGYKKTELGWIPKDWKSTTLYEIGEFSKGKGVSKKELIENGNLPCIRYAEIYTKYDFYTYSFESRIDEESADASKEISTGDLLFAGSGETLEDIGKSLAYVGKDKAFAGGDIVIFKQRTEDSQYLGYLLNHEIVRRQLYKLGQGHSVVHVYPKSLEKIKIPLPPLPEQQKIVRILSTWDKAIAKQEALIAYKRQLKKGLMQQLLTGKKRLRGFDSNWTNHEFGSFVERSKEKSNQTDKSHRCLELEHFEQGTGKINGYTNSSFQKSSKNRFYQNDVLFGKLRPYLRKYWLAEFDGVCSTEIWVFQADSDKCTSKFLFYLIQQNKFIQVANVTTGSKMPRADWKYIEEVPFLLPPIAEQSMIASVISAADREIALLQKCLQELEKQKQGLMQKLLTGEIRVKTNAN